MPSSIAFPVTWRHHLGAPSTTATSVETCSPLSSGIHMWPGFWLARYSFRVLRTRLPVPMPRMLEKPMFRPSSAASLYRRPSAFMPANTSAVPSLNHAGGSASSSRIR